MSPRSVDIFFTLDAAINSNPDTEIAKLLRKHGRDYGVIGLVRRDNDEDIRGHGRAFLTVLLKDDKSKEHLEQLIIAGRIRQITLARPSHQDEGITGRPSRSRRSPAQASQEMGMERDILGSGDVQDENRVERFIDGRERLWQTSHLAAIPLERRLQETVVTLQQSLDQEIVERNLRIAMNTARRKEGKSPLALPNEHREKEAFGLNIPSDRALIVQLVSNFVTVLINSGIPFDRTRQLVLNASQFVLPIDTVIRDKIKEQVIRHEDLSVLRRAYSNEMNQLLDSGIPLDNIAKRTQYKLDLRAAAFPKVMGKKLPKDLIADATLVARRAYRFCVPLSRALDLLEEGRQEAETGTELEGRPHEVEETDRTEMATEMEGRAGGLRQAERKGMSTELDGRTDGVEETNRTEMAPAMEGRVDGVQEAERTEMATELDGRADEVEEANRAEMATELEGRAGGVEGTDRTEMATESERRADEVEEADMAEIWAEFEEEADMEEIWAQLEGPDDGEADVRTVSQELAATGAQEAEEEGLEEGEIAEVES